MLRDLAFKNFCYEVCVKQKKNARLFTTDPLSRLLVSIESGQHWIGPAAPRPISSSRGIAAMSHDSITSPMHSLCDEISLETADMSSFRNTTEGACHNIIATLVLFPCRVRTRIRWYTTCRQPCVHENEHEHVRVQTGNEVRRGWSCIGRGGSGAGNCWGCLDGR